MNLTVNKGSDLLTKKAYGELSPAEAKTYSKSATEFVKTFNTSNPDGKEVKVRIKQIRFTDNGIAIALHPHNDLSTTTVNLPEEIGNIIAENCGVNNVDGLALLVRSSLSPIFLVQTVKAVDVTDTYMSQGIEKSYACPTMTKVTGTYESVELSKDAQDLVAEMAQDALRAIIMGSGRKKPSVANAVVRRSAEVEEDATV
jgi:hypothetical protein